MVEGAWALTSETWAQILMPPRAPVVSGFVYLSLSFPTHHKGPGCHRVAGAVVLSASAAGRQALG